LGRSHRLREKFWAYSNKKAEKNVAALRDSSGGEVKMDQKGEIRDASTVVYEMTPIQMEIGGNGAHKARELKTTWTTNFSTSGGLRPVTRDRGKNFAELDSSGKIKAKKKEASAEGRRVREGGNSFSQEK